MEHKLPPTSSLSEAELLILLSERQCREALRILQRSTSPLTAIEMARRIADREFDTPAVHEVQTIHLVLQNNDLPRLDEADVVAYDVAEQTIRPGVNFDAIMNFLANVNETGLSWSGE